MYRDSVSHDLSVLPDGTLRDVRIPRRVRLVNILSLGVKRRLPAVESGLSTLTTGVP